MYYLNTSDGVRCAVEDIHSADCKHTILFVHGWPLSHDVFEWQFSVLPKYGYRCISVDLRGFGDSDKPWGSYCYDTLADDLYCIIRRLELYEPVTLLGFSMGGAICARYMSRHKGYGVERLVLAGAAAPKFESPPCYGCGFTKSQIDCLIADCYNDRFRVYHGFAQKCFNCPTSCEMMNWFQDICEKSSGYATVKTLEALRDEDVSCDLKSIHVPTAIFHGVHDKIVPFFHAKEMKAAIVGSFIRPFECSGHCCFYDESGAFNRALIDFISATL